MNMAQSTSDIRGGPLAYFTRHRTAANLLLVVLLVLGAAAMPNIRAQFFPDVIVERIEVHVIWDGAGPEDIDQGIVQIMEPTLLVVDGVKTSSSSSREGRASINLEFEPGWDMARGYNDVQAAVDTITNLPEDADEPTVRRSAWRDRVTDIVITGPVDIAQLGLLADELIVRLFENGVTRTIIRGMTAPRTVVEVPSIKLVEHEMTMARIANAIVGEVNAKPAGDVTGASARVRTGVERRSPDNLAGIVLRSNPDGSTLTIGDLAAIRVEGIDRGRSYFVGGQPAISIRVDRSDKGDALKIQRQVENIVAEMQRSVPQGVTLELIRTRAEAITGRLNLLVDNGLLGLGLVLLLLFLFLNARTAFWVAAGIPAAMFAAVALMYAFGITLNMVSLFGLIITLGIVVDDAIVVGEHADYRARRLGEDPVTAAENAARLMFTPVSAATLTTVIAFFGLTAVGGRFGDLIRDIPFTVIAVLLASLVECFLILPHHMSRAIAHSAKQQWYDLPGRVMNRGFRLLRDRAFRPFMILVLRARYPVLAGAFVLLAGQLALFIKGEVPWRFFNAPERGSVTGNFAMHESATRGDTLAMMRELQRATEEMGRQYADRHGRNPLDYVLAEIGGNAGRALPGAAEKDPDLLGGISIELIDADLRPYSSFQFVADLQDAVRRHPLLETISFRGWRSGPGGDALDVQLFGADLDTLKAASQDLQSALAQYPEVSAVEDNLAYGKEELILDLTPQGRALGFTIGEVGQILRNRLAGIEAATYPVGVRSADIRVELPPAELRADFLERTYMRKPSGGYVPLSDIVTVERRSGFSTVRRENGVRLVSVTGDISEDNPARAALIEENLKERILPRIAEERQVEWRLSGLSEQENEFLSDSGFGFVLCLSGIYLILAWIFASWIRPLVVMSVIPFGLVGTIWGHQFWNVPLSMFTVVGLLGLTGIIINDSIVLVNTIDRYANTRGLYPSIIEGTVDRLRPVLLTTMTTVLGLTPLLFERSQQAQFLKPTVITLVYGLGFGMFIVLLVVPALLAIQEDFARPVVALRRALTGSRRDVRRVAVIALALMLAWFGITFGPVLIGGSVPGFLPFLPTMLPKMPDIAVSLTLFGSGLVGILTLVFLLALLPGILRKSGTS